MNFLVLSKFEYTVVDQSINYLCFSFVKKQFFKPVFIVIVIIIVSLSHVVQQIFDVLIIGIVSVPASTQSLDLTSEKSSGTDHHSVWKCNNLIIISCKTYLKTTVRINLFRVVKTAVKHILRDLKTQVKIQTLLTMNIHL